jgi:hypothetical protein
MVVKLTITVDTNLFMVEEDTTIEVDTLVAAEADPSSATATRVGEETLAIMAAKAMEDIQTMAVTVEVVEEEDIMMEDVEQGDALVDEEETTTAVITGEGKKEATIRKSCMQ